MMFSNNQDITVNVIKPLQDLHEEIRQKFEAMTEGRWRVTDIKGSSVSSYGVYLTSRTAPTPDYTLTQIIAEFDIYAVENGPLEKVIDGTSMSLSLHSLSAKGYLLSNGKLRIVTGYAGYGEKK